MNFKRAASAVCALVLAGGMFCVPVSNGMSGLLTDITASAETYQDFMYNYNDDGTLTIKSYFGEAEEVEIPSVINKRTVTAIASNAFNGRSTIKSVIIPETIISVSGSSFINCGGLSSIVVDENNPEFCSVDGVLYNKDMTTLIRCPDGIETEELAIPEGVESIGLIAFNSCKNIVSVTMPDSVTSIGYGAFLVCMKLESITMSPNITSIGANCFFNCRSLAEIEIPEGITEIGDSTFASTNLTEVTIPDGVTVLGKSAFSNCGALTEVTIPDTVESIGDSAFSGCAALTDVYYGGSQDEWDDIVIGSSNALLSEAELHCSGTVIKNPKVSFEAGRNAVKLTWKPAANAQKYAIAGYQGGKWKLLATGPATADSYVIKNLKEGVEYQVAVVAMIDGKWNMDFSRAITVSPKPVVPEDFPIVTQSIKGSQFRLDWTAVENAEGYAVALYAGGKWKLLKAVDANTLSYISPKMPDGKYNIAVAAKLNGKWDTYNIKSRGLVVTIDTAATDE